MEETEGKIRRELMETRRKVRSKEIGTRMGMVDGREEGERKALRDGYYWPEL